MKILHTLALVLGLMPVLWGQTCTFDNTETNPAVPELLPPATITNCLDDNDCDVIGAGESGCTVVIVGDFEVEKVIDLTGYPDLTFTIQEGTDVNDNVDGSGGSLTFDNRGNSNNKVGELRLAFDATLIVEDTEDVSVAANSIYTDPGGADGYPALANGGSENGNVLIRFVNPDPNGADTEFTEDDLDNIITNGGADANGVLPIELLSFGAEVKGDRIQVSWRTATELNNDYMAVEHSPDGRRYAEIGRVLGAGTTQEPQDYRFTHDAPATGLNYYRLRQVDYDGQYEYHGPVTARFGNGAGVLDVFPTATADELTVSYDGQLGTDATLSIQSTSGRTLREWAWGSKSGRRTAFSVADLPAGWYVLRLRSGREVVAGRFLKQ